jgi:hypothetical protein
MKVFDVGNDAHSDAVVDDVVVAVVPNNTGS